MGGSFTCKDCKDRYVGCHSKCENYKKQKELHEKRKQEYKDNTNPVITKCSFMGDPINYFFRKSSKF